MASSLSEGSAAATKLPATCSRVRMPGMTTDTSGNMRIHRRANAAIVVPSGTNARIASTAGKAAFSKCSPSPLQVSPLSKKSPDLLKVLWSVCASDAKYSALILPVSKPEARGTRTIIPTSAVLARGKKSSAGLSRKQLKMISMAAQSGWALHNNASSTVSTETPQCAILPSFTRVRKMSKSAPLRRVSVGGQCINTRSRVSTPSRLLDAATAARKASSW
mmetsp:Transcript_99565/g.157581  ORF Transcript_99565/g.157581 Transcript_99565/m.157581 type:complete len:220 (-) Transcript_99565:143-802(-)